MTRQIFTIILLCSAWLTAISSTVIPNDTVAKISNPEEIEIMSNGDTLKIKTKGFYKGKGYGTYTYSYAKEKEDDSNDWEINLPFVTSYREKSKRQKPGSRLKVRWCHDFYVGGVIGIDKPSGMGGGWEIGLDNFIGLYWSAGRMAPVFSIGAGLGYRSMNYSGGYMLSQTGKTLTIVPVDDEITNASSRLHLFRLSVPFMITQPLGCGVSARVGAILNLNTYMSATTKVKSHGESSKQSFHSLEQRFATPDFYGSILYKNTGIYVRWSPVSLFTNEWGPRYKAVSVGVNFTL